MMTRSKNSTKLVALLMSLVLITSCFVGGTLARYITSTSSEDSARVAVWGINADEVEMDLFDAQYELDGTVVAKANDGDNIIAPGTGKMSKFSIVNLDDTLAPEVMYEIKIDVDDTEIDQRILDNPSIQWKLDDNSWGTWESTKVDILALSGDASGVKVYAPLEIATEFANGVEHTISWQWLLDNNNDTQDTTMGNEAIDGDITAKIVVEITAEQTDGSSIGLLNGKNQIFDLNNPIALTFRSAAPLNELQSVEIDGSALTKDTNYTATEGSTVITVSEDYLSTLEIGTHEIAIISTNSTAKTTFNIVTVSNVLSENSWDTISKVVKSGKASTYWSIGDTTTVAINDTNKTVALAGFDHDGENTVTFAFKETIVRKPMNVASEEYENGDNIGGWKDSEMRTIILPEIYEQMENKEYIKRVEKQTIVGFGTSPTAPKTLETTIDKLFLFSTTEIKGNSNGFGEGTQYAYFKTSGSNVIDSSPSGYMWWTRTPSAYVDNYFYHINTDGYKGLKASSNDASVIPGFVIG